jgi:hypothetical protein
MKNVSDKSCRENQSMCFIFNKSFSKNCAVYEIMWKNIVEPDMPQMTIWCMCIACLIAKATRTLGEYVIIIAFPQQQWLHDAPQCYVYKYISCLVHFPCS